MASLEIDVAKLFVGPNWSDTMKGHKLQLLKHQCTCHTVSIHKPSYGWPNPYPQTINFISKVPHIMDIMSIGWIYILATLSAWSPPSTHEVSRTVKLYNKKWIYPCFFAPETQNFLISSMRQFSSCVEILNPFPKFHVLLEKRYERVVTIDVQFMMKVNLKREKDN